jgi:GDP-L-fucose synthase
MQRSSKIYVAGHRGLVGSAMVRELQRNGFENLVFRTHGELDLTDQRATDAFFSDEKPDYVFLCAAKVGGILANKTHKADFLEDNLRIVSNVIASAHRFGAKKLLNLGSTCIYPKEATLPIREEALLTGPLEETNDAYAIAKIAGIMLGRAYRQQHGFNVISAQPSNLYGPGDNFSADSGHVIPALMARMHAAKVDLAARFTVWGSGRPLREFLYVDDLASALLLLMERYDDELHINVGTEIEISIKQLAELLQYVTGFKGELLFDKTKPDGTLRKVSDCSRIRSFGWSPKVDIEEGLSRMYAVFSAPQVSSY